MIARLNLKELRHFRPKICQNSSKKRKSTRMRKPLHFSVQKQSKIIGEKYFKDDIFS